MPQGGYGENYLTDLLKQIQGVRTGQTRITELPEYKYMVSDLTKNYESILPEINKMMTSQNLSPNAISEMYRKMNEGKIMGNLGAERQAYETAIGGGTDIAKYLAGLSEAEAARTLGAWQTYKERHFRQEQAKMDDMNEMFKFGMEKFIDSMSGASGSGACCFIFIEGNALTDNVRNLRDEMFPKGGIVENGYRKMSQWLVPKMERNWFIKEIVKIIMLKPICLIADHYYGHNFYGWVFRPIGHFWKKVWEKMGHA